MKSGKYRVVAVILCVVMVLAMLPARTRAVDWTIPIYTAEEFLSIMDAPGGSYRLEADLNLGSILPLGAEKSYWNGAFSGSLDGNGHTITCQISSVDGLYAYGLFAWINGAKISNLSLDIRVSVNLEGNGNYYEIGTLAGSAYSSTFSNVDISGQIVVSDNGGEYADNLMVTGVANGDGICHTCTVNVGIDVQAGADDKVQYYGMGQGKLYHSDLSGSVNLRGMVEEAVLLYNGDDCTCGASLYVTTSSAGFDICGDVMGIENALYGAIAVDAFRDIPYDMYPYGSVLGLSNSQGSRYTGRILADMPGVMVSGANQCQGVTVAADILVSGHDGNGVVVHGLQRCTYSTMNGNIQVNAGVCSIYPLSNSSNCRYYGDADFNCYDYSDMFGVFGGEFNLFEGNLSGYVSNGGSGVFPTGGNACNSAFYGSCYAACAANSTAMSFGSEGEGNVVCASITALSADERGSVEFRGTNCFFEGSIVSGTVGDSSSNSSIRADITALQGTVSVAGGSNMYFSGNVEVYGVADYTTNVSVGCGTNCVADANVRVFHKGAKNPENPFYKYPGCGFNIGSTTGSFSGSVSIAAAGGKVTGTSTVPVSIDHAYAGMWNSESIGISVDVHNRKNCKKYEEGAIFHHAQKGDYPCGYFDGWQTHWEPLISVNRIEGVSPDTASAGWDGSVDPENGNFTPERDPVSYTIRIVDVNEQPITGAYLILDGQAHSLDSDGCYSVQNGPAVISKLEVMSVDKHTGEMVTLATRTAYCPFPDMVNVLKLQPNLSLSLNFLGDGGTEGERNNFRIPGVDWDFDLPMNFDIQGSLGDYVKFQFKLDPVTGDLDVMAGATVDGGKHPNMKWEDFTNLRDCVFYGLRGDMRPEKAESLLRGSTKKKTSLGIGTWETQFMGIAKMHYDADLMQWQLKEFGGLIGAALEQRLTAPIASIPGLYWTAALKGACDFYVGENGANLENPEASEINVYGKLSPSLRLEGAVGAGVRNARLYAEIGLGGEVNADIETPFVNMVESLSVEGIFDIFCEFCFLTFSERTQLLKVTATWPDSGTKSLRQMLAQALGGEMTMMPRSYAYGTLATESVGQNGGFLGLDGENSYPYSQVRLQPLSDGRYLLLYTDDDLSRGDADRSALRACIGTQTDGVLRWGESITLEADGTGDYGFHAAVSGTKVAVIWQDTTETFGDGAGLTPAELSKYVVLSQTILDCSGETPEAGQIAVVSSEGDYPYYPTVYYDGSIFRAAWVTTSNPDPSVYSADEQETVWISEGFGSTGSVAAENQKSIRGLALIRQSLCWSDTDTLWHYAGDGSVAAVDSGSILHLQSNGRKMCYVKDQTLYLGETDWSQVRGTCSGEACSDVVRLGADGTVYTARSGLEVSRICRIQDGNALPIGEFQGILSDWDAAKGHLVSVIRSGFGENDPSSFHSQPQTLLESLIVEHIQWENVAAGANVVCTVTISNDGGSDIDSFPVTITADDGTVLYSTDQYCMLKPGEEGSVSFAFPLPADYSTQRVSVTIGSETSREILGGSNLSLDAQWSPGQADGILAVVTNTGTEDASGSVAMMAADGSVLGVREVSVSQGETVRLWFPFAGYYGEKTLITLVLTESDDAMDTSDNTVTVAVKPVEAEKVRVCDSLTLNRGESAPLEIRAVPAGSRMPALDYSSENEAIARVDGNGTVTGVSAGVTTITVKLENGTVHTVTVQVLDHGPVNPFTDVIPGSFYYDPVMWAVEEGITNGTSATTFGPEDQCMRAQVVTFLWRAAGQPEPASTEHPFVDVKPDDFYYKPVLWAVEQGITNGLDATHFGPMAYCNRAQVVTFLWRAQGKPEPAGSNMPFTDVQAGAWYASAIAWAVENGITNGMTITSFGIDTICNRAQIVTFLYRSYVKD